MSGFVVDEFPSFPVSLDPNEKLFDSDLELDPNDYLSLNKDVDWFNNGDDFVKSTQDEQNKIDLIDEMLSKTFGLPHPLNDQLELSSAVNNLANVGQNGAGDSDAKQGNCGLIESGSFELCTCNIVVRQRFLVIKFF